MKEVKIPTSVKVFRAKKFISDKKSDLKYKTNKIKENERLKDLARITKELMQRFVRNLRENADNWFYRANADEGFLIDD